MRDHALSITSDNPKLVQGQEYVNKHNNEYEFNPKLHGDTTLMALSPGDFAY